MGIRQENETVCEYSNRILNTDLISSTKHQLAVPITGRKKKRTTKPVDKHGVLNFTRTILRQSRCELSGVKMY